MRELGLAGAVAVLFGLGAYWATGEFEAFNAVNVGAGGLAFVAYLALRARRLRGVGGPHARRVMLRGLAWIALALVVSVGAERAADRAGWRFDWTREGSFEPSEAVRRKLGELPREVDALLFYDPFDPRKRRTRLLLQTLARLGPLSLREYELDASPELEDRYEVGTSNTVVLVMGDRFETVERPTEGAIFEALYRLDRTESGALLVLRGAGDGDVERGDELGFSGLAVALQTEGYAVKSAVSAALREVPERVDAVLAIAPRRRLPGAAIEALRGYLERGGSLVAFLEPGVESGVESLLAEYGLRSPDGLLIDPASASLDGNADGVGILAYNYETHAVTRGLNRNRMAFFPGARSFVLRRPAVGDEVKRLVLASPRSWLSEDLTLLERQRSLPEPPSGARQDYHPVAVGGRYPRDAGESRIVAFGDSDFASNAHARTLFNLDLAINAVHWAAQREPAITLRPKIRNTVQFPLPVENTLRTLYGVGLLVPELLLIAGGIVWLRRRTA